MRKLIPGIALTLCTFASTIAAASFNNPVQQQAAVEAAGEGEAKPTATLLANTEAQFSAKELLTRKPETNAERMNLAKLIVIRHIAPNAPARLAGKELASAKKQVAKLMDEAQNKDEPRVALEMAVQLYLADDLGFKDEKKVVKLLENAVKNGVPYAGADLAVAYSQGALGLKPNTTKALELINADTGARNAHVLAFKASLLGDPTSSETYDLEAAIAAARLAYSMNAKDEMVVSLLSGLLITNRANEAHVKEGHELLTQWTHKRRQIENEENAAVAHKAVDIALKRNEPKVMALPPGTKLNELTTETVEQAANKPLK